MVEVILEVEEEEEGEGEEGEGDLLIMVLQKELSVSDWIISMNLSSVNISFSFAELGMLMHSCQNDLVCKGTNAKIPYFNAPIFLENKSQIGKIDEIFGPMNEFVSFKNENKWLKSLY